MSAKTWIKRSAVVVAVGAVGLVAGAPNAEAGNDSKTFVVSTNVVSACTLTTAPLTFPGYTSGSAFDVTASTTFRVNCPGASATASVPVTFTFNAASGPASFTMQDGAATPNSLNYELCQTAGCASKYVYNTAGAPITINSLNQAYVLGGQIPSAQNAPQGAYDQTLNAILTF